MVTVHTRYARYWGKSFVAITFDKLKTFLTSVKLLWP
mgnify:FL=1